MHSAALANGLADAATPWCWFLWTKTQIFQLFWNQDAMQNLIEVWLRWVRWRVYVEGQLPAWTTLPSKSFIGSEHITFLPLFRRSNWKLPQCSCIFAFWKQSHCKSTKKRIKSPDVCRLNVLLHHGAHAHVPGNKRAMNSSRFMSWLFGLALLDIREDVWSHPAIKWQQCPWLGGAVIDLTPCPSASLGAAGGGHTAAAPWIHLLPKAWMKTQ